MKKIYYALASIGLVLVITDMQAMIVKNFPKRLSSSGCFYPGSHSESTEDIHLIDVLLEKNEVDRSVVFLKKIQETEKDNQEGIASAEGWWGKFLCLTKPDGEGLQLWSFKQRSKLLEHHQNSKKTIDDAIKGTVNPDSDVKKNEQCDALLQEIDCVQEQILEQTVIHDFVYAKKTHSRLSAFAFYKSLYPKKYTGKLFGTYMTSFMWTSDAVDKLKNDRSELYKRLEEIAEYRS